MTAPQSGIACSKCRDGMLIVGLVRHLNEATRGPVLLMHEWLTVDFSAIEMERWKCHVHGITSAI